MVAAPYLAGREGPCAAALPEGRGRRALRHPAKIELYRRHFRRAAADDRDGAHHVARNERRLAVAHRHLRRAPRSEEHTSELQSLMRISYAVFCLQKKKKK